MKSIGIAVVVTCCTLGLAAYSNITLAEDVRVHQSKKSRLGKKNKELKHFVQKYDAQLSKQEDLLWSAWSGDTKNIHVLVNAGVQPDFALSDGRTAVHFAAENCQAEAIQVLSSYKANVNLQKKGSKESPLHMAVQNNCSAGVSALLAARGNTQLKNAKGETPLMMARRLKKENLIKVLKKQS